MVKVSITLPNNALITFESEEPEVIHEIVGMVLRDLPRDLMQGAGPVNGDSGLHESGLRESGLRGEPTNGKAPAAVEINVSEGQPPEQLSSGEQSVAGAVRKAQIANKANPSPKTTRDTTTTPPAAKATVANPTVARQATTDAETSFAEFCRVSNPLGDMRRVVVAAEGARRFMGAASVDAESLGRLFDLVGWPRPHSFVQTLRNAARSKFRWLERVPGRSGFYTVTEVGRSTAFGG